MAKFSHGKNCNVLVIKLDYLGCIYIISEGREVARKKYREHHYFIFAKHFKLYFLTTLEK